MPKRDGKVLKAESEAPLAAQPTPVRPDQDNPQLEEAVNRPSDVVADEPVADEDRPADK